MKNSYKWKLVPVAILVSSLGFVANPATAAQQFFDVNGTTNGSGVVNGGSYSWEGATWASNSVGTTPSFAWTEGNQAQFSAGTDATGSYTVTASANHTISALRLTAGSNNTVTIDGPGQLTLTGGSNQFAMQTPLQNLVISASLTGSSAIGFTAGTVSLYGNNSYTGSTFLNNATTVNFNNNNSFGTGTIWWVGQTATISPQGSSAITLPNAMNTGFGGVLTVAGSATAPTTINGAVNILSGGTGTATITVGNAGNPNTQLTLAGPISGGNLIVNGTTGSLILAGSNNFGGSLTAGGTTKITLANNNALHGVTSLIMNGGTVAINGTANSLGTLGLTASSTIDFLSGGTLTLASSSGNAWNSGTVLNLGNYVNDEMRVGTDSTGLTVAQLAQIEFNGTDLGDAIITADGHIEDSLMVPEPSSIALGALGGLAMLWMVKRRKNG